MKLFFPAILVPLLLSVSCVTVERQPGCDADGAGCRPFRTGMLKFDEVLDADKSVSAIDEAGWALATNSIIGGYRDGWISAFDLKNKTHLWWYKADSDLTAPAEVFGSWAILPLRDGRLVKVEIATGKAVWDVRLTQFVASKIILSGSTLLAYSVDQKLYGIDFQSGQNLWVYDAGTAPNLLLRSGAGPQVTGSEVFLGTADGDVRSISLANGKENWRMRPIKDDFRFKDIVGEIGVSNNQIYLTRYDGLVFAVDTAQKPRDPSWEKTYPSITTSAYRDGTIYIGCLNGDLVALQAATGKQLWKVNLGQSIKSLTAGEKAIFVGGSQGRVSAVSLAGGQLLWHDDLGGVLTKQPFVLEDEIYFASGLKVIYGYKILF